ncbi:helix-turn-helix transcriptional regulator [Streptomyces poonensis]|uniref:helix-turn-helix transcriptional regulator n=1 Tax=Streptomyces poonensis TaxID=68255 RepID=UPI001E4B8962|nr:AraC family transcriptional regulator [Streptomyces poonensis]
MDDEHRGGVSRKVLSTSDAEKGEQFLISLYGMRIRMGLPAGPGTVFRHERRTADRLCMDFHALPMRVTFAAEPLDHLLVAEATVGRVRIDHAGDSGRFAAGDVLVPVAPGLPYSTDSDGYSNRVAVLDLALLRDVAGLDHEHRVPLRLLRPYRPAAPAHALLWRGTAGYAWRLLDPEERMATALMWDAAARLLAAVALTAFPTTYTSHDPLRRAPGHVGEATVSRAVDFIDAHADRPLGLSEVAAAVRTGPRALLGAFRRRLGTTPAGYVHRVRLARVHAELRAADPATGVTVAEIAARWGFRCDTRFTIAYRKAYGRLPRQTLHQEVP